MFDCKWFVFFFFLLLLLVKVWLYTVLKATCLMSQYYKYCYLWRGLNVNVQLTLKSHGEGLHFGCSLCHLLALGLWPDPYSLSFLTCTLGLWGLNDVMHVNHSDDFIAEMITDSWFNATPEGRLISNFLI